MKHLFLFLLPLLFLSCTTKTANVKEVDHQTVWVDQTYKTIATLSTRGEGTVKVLPGDSIVNEVNQAVVTQLIAYTGKRARLERTVELSDSIPKGKYVIVKPTQNK